MKMKSAWLITWEWCGDHVSVDEKVVAFINYRKPASYVKDFIEQLYIEKTSTVSEKAAYAKNKNLNPYPACYGEINGVPWHGRIWCGDNPYLFGRLVKNVCISPDDLKSNVTWDESS